MPIRTHNWPNDFIMVLICIFHVNLLVPVPLELNPVLLISLRIRLIHLSSNVYSFVRCDGNHLFFLFLVRRLILYYKFFLDPLLVILILFFSLIDNQSVFLIVDNSYLFIIQHLHLWYLALNKKTLLSIKWLIFLKDENLKYLMFCTI